MSGGSANVSKECSRKSPRLGAIVVDKFLSPGRMRILDVPLIRAGKVNADALDDGIKKGIIANPNCSTIQTGRRPENPCTMQPESTACRSPTTSPPPGGRGKGMDELWSRPPPSM